VVGPVTVRLATVWAVRSTTYSVALLRPYALFPTTVRSNPPQVALAALPLAAEVRANAVATRVDTLIEVQVLPELGAASRLPL